MKLISLSLICVFFVQIHSIGQNNTMSQGEMISKNVYHEIPYTDYKKEIFQSVQLKDKTYKFILDTGAPLVISSELQAKHKFQVLIKTPIKDSNNNSDTIFIVLVDTIKIGEIVFINIPTVVLNFKDSPIACENVDGLLGSNILRFLTVQFNLRKKKVILTDNQDKIDFIGNKNNTLYLDGQSNAFLKVEFNKTFYDTAHFDSGMRRLYDMDSKAAKNYLISFGDSSVLAYKGVGSSSQGVFGKGKTEQQFLLKANELNIGNSLIKNIRFNNTNKTSRIGREILQYGTLTLDYPNKIFCFNPYPKNEYIKKQNFGFQPQSQDGKLLVGVVWQDTQADKLGLKSGDEITSINGKSFTNLSSCQINEIVAKAFSKKSIKIICNNKELIINTNK